MFYPAHNTDVNTVDRIVHLCFNVIYVSMLKFVQLNQRIHHHPIHTMLHLHSLLVRTNNRTIDLSIFGIGQARRFKKLCEEIQLLFTTSKERLAKQRRPQEHQTNENRSIISGNYSASTTTATSSSPNSNTFSTPRSNASFISSLFGYTNSACMCWNFFASCIEHFS